jgi:hypothetical protein
MVASVRFRHKQDLLPASPDVGRQVRIGAELAVTLVDLADGLDHESPHHQRSPAWIRYGERFGAGYLGRRIFAVRRQVAKLGRGLSFLVYQEWANRCRVRSFIEQRGQASYRIRFDLSIFVKEQDVLGIGRAPPDIERPGQPKIFG